MKREDELCATFFSGFHLITDKGMSFKILLSVIKCPDCTGAAVIAATCRQVFLICFDCLQGRHGDQVCSSNRGCPLMNEFCKVPVAIIAPLWLEACWQNTHPLRTHSNPSFLASATDISHLFVDALPRCNI